MEKEYDSFKKLSKRREENLARNAFAMPHRMTKKGQTEFSRFRGFMAKMQHEKEKTKNKKLEN